MLIGTNNGIVSFLVVSAPLLETECLAPLEVLEIFGTEPHEQFDGVVGTRFMESTFPVMPAAEMASPRS